MWSDQGRHEDNRSVQAKIKRLESYHQRSHGILLFGLLCALGLFVLWASSFRIDEVAKATGEVIASSRVQVIQAVDGGVLSEMYVKEGDIVKPGQLLARLDQTRVGASVGEVEARLFALKAKTIRLRAEVTGARSMHFPDVFKTSMKDVAAVEKALFKQRRFGLNADIRMLKVAVRISKEEMQLTEKLRQTGDASGSELLRAQRTLNDAEAKLANRRNGFLEDARVELTRAEDEIAQNLQVLTRRQQEQKDSSFTALAHGIVKNIRVTTIGGVLRAGEEIMQIVPIGDDLIVEAKVSPADIAKVRRGLDATIRFDPFDYTIFGGVQAEVIYVSADTLKEETSRGIETYYRVHISPKETPVVTTIGRTLDILPGMTAQVDVRTGDRTLMDFLLKPLRKTLSESFGER